MGVDQAIDITAEERQTILSLLGRHLPGTAAWVYGSRAKWTSRPESDLDLVVFATPEQRERIGDLREAFEESNLPFRVDLFVWEDVPTSFRTQIEAEHFVLVRKDSPDSTCNGWGALLLRDVCIKIGSGATPRGGRDVYLRDGPCSLVRSQNVYNEGFRHDGLAFISERQAAALKNVQILADDVLLNITGDSVARACQVAPDILPARVNQHVAIIRPDSRKLSAKFLRYCLIHPKIQATLLSWAGSGGTRNALTKSMIESFQVFAPVDVAEQRAIANILGTLDDKIELNRRMNATLEAMARALFKSWFVDFDPVRAKMEGRDTGLPKDVADLFPDQLVDSELGEIPEGWTVSEIGKEVDVVGGATPSTRESSYWNGHHNWATPKDLSKLLSPVLLGTNRTITNAGVQKISSGLLPTGTVLLSSRAPIGYLAIAEVPTAVNQGFIAMICRKRLQNLYVLFWCSENLEYIKGISGGSTFAEINKKTFRPLPVLVPPKGILEAYDDVSRSLYDRVVLNTRESTLLVSLRDILLPKLVSGEVRVPDAERLAKAVGRRDVAGRLRPTELR